MLGKLRFCVIGLCVLGSGCTLFQNAVHTVSFRMNQSLDERAEWKRNQQWAEAAWNDIRSSDAAGHYTEDYALGFKDGFATYLFKGGNGEPPPVPPRQYRKLKYQSPQGYQAVEEWFAGYRHGASVAHQDGYRQWVTGPSALRQWNQNFQFLEAAPERLVPAKDPLEQLPPPRPEPGPGQAKKETGPAARKAPPNSSVLKTPAPARLLSGTDLPPAVNH
jgi:hypothetical protein